MASLKSLQVPRKLLSRGHGSKPEGNKEQEDENKSDFEKSIWKEKSVLFKVLTAFCVMGTYNVWGNAVQGPDCFVM